MRMNASCAMALGCVLSCVAPLGPSSEPPSDDEIEGGRGGGSTPVGGRGGGGGGAPLVTDASPPRDSPDGSADVAAVGDADVTPDGGLIGDAPRLPTGMGTLGWTMPAESPPDEPLPACKREVAVSGDAALASALTAAAPGDCILVADGSYKAPRITVTGTAAAPVVLRARNKLGARFNTGQLLVERSAYLVIEGFRLAMPSTFKVSASNHVRITRNQLALTVADDWVLVYGAGSQRNRIDHNEFATKPTPGPYLVFGQEDTMSQYDRVDHNHFHDNGPPAVNEKESVRIGWSGVSRQDGFVVVEHNLFENCDGDPEIVSVKTNKNVVRHNTVRASAGVLSLRHGNGSFLYGNIILGGGKTLPCKDRQGADTTCGTGGIRIYGRDHVIWNNHIVGTTGTGHRAPLQIDGGDGTSLDAHHQVVGVQVVANTIVGNDSGLEIGRNYTSEPRDVVVAYNVVSAPAGKAVQVWKPKATVRFEGNVVWAAGGAVGVTLRENEARVVEPRLALADELFRPQNGSPLIDAAAALAPYVADDVEGRARRVPDVGAVEAGPAPGPRRALTAHDVGPDAP